MNNLQNNYEATLIKSQSFEIDKWINLGKDIVKLREKIKHLEEQESLLMEDLKAMVNYQDFQAGQIKLSRKERKGSVEYRDIPQLKTVDLELYRKPSIEYWKLEIVLDLI